jgi:hypothetical protein
MHHKETGSDYTKYEISLSAEYLNRGIEEICDTLLHEMIHLYNALNNIKDTSSNYVYHNKKFKEGCENHGLLVEKDKKLGWSITTLKPETKEYINTLNIHSEVFEYYRKSIVQSPKIKIELTSKEKLDKMYERLDKLKEKIKELEAEVK